MTPQARKTLHAAIDHAINVGAHIDINIHPPYADDATDLIYLIARDDAGSWPSAGKTEDYIGWDADEITDLTIYLRQANKRGARPGPVGAARAQVRV